MKKIIPILIIVFITVISCSKNKEELSPAEQLKIDIALIEGYLVSHNLTAQKTSSGLFYLITEEGTGSEHPTVNDRVKVHYRGYYLESGVVFDQNFDNDYPTPFLLANTIKGWREGIPLFTKGAKGMLFIPSGLAYGPYPESGIEPNAVLIFEIKLLDFFQ
ncbi:MAG: peptidylprolyl isomerase [Bacteroidetes bacterium HGW-Bacteroidetes-17]|jgi:FKBP-type peptidyl-prolyl cis-trans isomerase|nr:MAG: peptidylprolyl isomerase [Bacteroidetes bacterium HGW-Bacteroidetes-17]